MVEHPEIRDFVQCTLGCGCPEEVFEKIEREADAVVGDGLQLREKIRVGDRLLIYLMDVDDLETLKSCVPALLEKGRKERDKIGFNRFRLVLAVLEIEALKPAAGELFKSSPDVDEKVHLHLVVKNDLEKLK